MDQDIRAYMQRLGTLARSASAELMKAPTGAKNQALLAAIQANAAWFASRGQEGAQAVLDGADLRVIADALPKARLAGASLRSTCGVGVSAAMLLGRMRVKGERKQEVDAALRFVAGDDSKRGEQVLVENEHNSHCTTHKQTLALHTQTRNLTHVRCNTRKQLRSKVTLKVIKIWVEGQ